MVAAPGGKRRISDYVLEAKRIQPATTPPQKDSAPPRSSRRRVGRGFPAVRQGILPRGSRGAEFCPPRLPREVLRVAPDQSAGGRALFHRERVSSRTPKHPQNAGAAPEIFRS